MISGEEISLQLGKETSEELKIPAVLAALLEHNEHARNKFHKLSSEHKIRLIQNIRGAKEMEQQIGISMELLVGNVK